MSAKCYSGQIFSKKMCIRDRLLDGEHFEPIEFEDEGMKKYLEIYRSQNFMLIGGKMCIRDRPDDPLVEHRHLLLSDKPSGYGQ